MVIEASASFQLKVNSGSYQAVGTAVDAVSGDTITAQLVSVEGVTGASIDWTIFGTHGGAAPALTEGGSPTGQTVSFTVPSSLLPLGGAYGLQCDVNGGFSVTGKSATTFKSAVYVKDGDGRRPHFLGETFESDASYGVVPDLRSGLSKVWEPTVVTSSPYTVLATDRIILVTTSTVNIELDLPAAATVKGKMLWVCDGTGTASTHNVTIDPDGTETIDGSAVSLVMSSDYFAVLLYSTGTAWLRLV